MSEQGVFAESKRLYFTDSMHKAQVDTAVAMVAVDIGGMSDTERAVATTCASVAIVMSKLDPQTGLPL